MAVDKTQRLMTVYQVLGLGWGRSKGRKAQGSGASHLARTLLHQYQGNVRQRMARDSTRVRRTELGERKGAADPSSLWDTKSSNSLKSPACSSNILKVQTHGSR